MTFFTGGGVSIGHHFVDKGQGFWDSSRPKRYFTKMSEVGLIHKLNVMMLVTWGKGLCLAAVPPFAVVCFCVVFYSFYREVLRPFLFHGSALPVLNLHQYGISHSEYKVVFAAIRSDASSKGIAAA